MEKYFYLSATPESLVASHLSPFKFGNYLAVGTKKRTKGQAIFFEIDPDKVDWLPWDYIDKKLVAYEDGEPKRSVFLSIYRVLENLLLNALLDLYLVTDDGKVLGLQKSDFKMQKEKIVHLYQQFIPNRTRVASRLSPPEFMKFLTDTSKPVSSPKLFFVELKLNKLAKDPEASLNNLPYPNPDHLRDCLIRLQHLPERPTKTVIRNFKEDLSFRTLKDGFFIGDQETFIFYPFPSSEELEDKYYSWWRSALVHSF